MNQFEAFQPTRAQQESVRLGQDAMTRSSTRWTNVMQGMFTQPAGAMEAFVNAGREQMIDNLETAKRAVEIGSDIVDGAVKSTKENVAKASKAAR
jgi:dihydropteroate synthase